MARATVLELFNKIQRNLGEPEVTSLAGLSTMNYLIFTTLRDKITDLATEYYWQPLEEVVDITLISGQTAYSPTTTGGTSINVMAYDWDSFNYNGVQPLKKYTFKQFDYQFPQRTSSGAPFLVYSWKEKVNLYYIPGSNENGKHVTGRCWLNPTLISTATATGTCWVPEAFDTCLLCDIVTYEILHYRGSPQAAVYYQKIHGGGNEEGGIDQMKRLYGSPDITDRNLVVEPMESKTTGNQQYIQGPILG